LRLQRCTEAGSDEAAGHHPRNPSKAKPRGLRGNILLLAPTLQHSATFTAEFDELLNHFSSFVNGRFRQVVIVVNALDEADKSEWTGLTHSIKTLHQRCHQLKILVTSRNERAIAREFEGLPTTTIEEADVASDITDFIRATLADRVEKKKLKLRDPDLEGLIFQTLLTGAKAMPLVSAIVGRNINIVRQLIDAGADLNARGGRHGCPPMAAAALAMDDLVEELVEAGGQGQ
jgi:hypothetical protein